MTFIRDRWNAERKLKVNPNGSIDVNASIVDGDLDSQDLIVYVDDTGDFIYVGEANVGSSTSDSAWRIRRLQEVGTITSVLWASGSSDFNKVWDDRSTYSYM